MSLKEYKPGAAFNGVIGRTFDVSSPAWPAPLRAKDGDQPDCNYCSDHQDSGIYDPVSLSIIKVLHGARGNCHLRQALDGISCALRACKCRVSVNCQRGEQPAFVHQLR